MSWALLGIVSEQLFEVTMQDLDAGDYLAGSCCPHERLRVAVPVLDVRLDCLDEYAQ